MEIDLDFQDSESKCSVCALPLENETSERRSSAQENLPPPLSILQKQLKTVFFMRNVLQLPVKRLVHFLKAKGDPENWIKFCPSCTKDVENVKKLFTELQTVSRKYEEAKSEILMKIGPLYKGDVNSGMPKECREWIVKKGLDKLKVLKDRSNDCFKDGDRKARKLALASKLKPGRLSTSTFQIQRKLIVTKAETSLFSSEDDDNVGAAEETTTPISAQDDDDDSNDGTKSDQMSDSNISNESGFLAPAPESESDDEWTPQPKKSKIKPEVEESAEVIVVEKRIQPDEGSANENLYSCSLCARKKNLDICEFTQHIYKSHQTQYKCIKCSRGFPVRDNFKILAHWSAFHKDKIKEVSNDQRVVKVDPILPDLDWPCPACLDTTFASEDLRDAHLVTCDDGRNVEKPFTCEACSKTYVNKEELELHIVIVHPGMFKETQFKCDICLEFFSTDKRLQSHKIRTHGADKFICDACGKNFYSKYSLESHQRDFHDGETGLNNVTCKFCQKTLSSVDCLKRHIRRVHEKVKEACVVCGEAFASSTWAHLYNVHGIRTGSRLKNFYCVFKSCNCGKAFPDLESIKEHIELKRVAAALTPQPPKEKKYVCDLCGVYRSTVVDVDFHKASFHKIGVEKFSCKDCGEFLGKRNARSKVHVCGVEKEKKHICDHCGFATTLKNTLTYHVKTMHEKKFDFLCELCSFGTNKRTHLAAHKANVHGIGDYPCKMKECSRVFANHNLMERHYRSIHEGIKMPRTHACSFCEARFRHGSNLKRHVLAHHATKEKIVL